MELTVCMRVFFLLVFSCAFNCCNFAAFHCCFNQTIACCLLLLFLFEIIWFVVINIVSLESNNTCQEGKNVLFFFWVFFQIFAFTCFQQFIYPLPREQGFEFMYAEFKDHKCYFTSLLHYQVRRY